MKNKTITILAILLILTIGYIAIAQYNTYQIKKEYSAIQYGAIQQVSEILKVTTQCKPYPIQITNNQTVNLILAECLSEGGK